MGGGLGVGGSRGWEWVAAGGRGKHASTLADSPLPSSNSSSPSRPLPPITLSTLNQPYLHEFGEDWVSSSPRRLVEKALNGLMARPGQQVVVLSQVLVDDVNTGFLAV